MEEFPAIASQINDVGSRLAVVPTAAKHSDIEYPTVNKLAMDRR
jgi:hypothetical protein